MLKHILEIGELISIGRSCEQFEGAAYPF